MTTDYLNSYIHSYIECIIALLILFVSIKEITCHFMLYFCKRHSTFNHIYLDGYTYLHQHTAEHAMSQCKKVVK